MPKNKGFALIQVLLMTAILLSLAVVVLTRANTQIESALSLSNKAQAQAKVETVFNNLLFSFYTSELYELHEGKSFNFYGQSFTYMDSVVTLQDNFGMIALQSFKKQEEFEALLNSLSVQDVKPHAARLYNTFKSKNFYERLIQSEAFFIKQGFTKEEAKHLWQVVSPYPVKSRSFSQMPKELLSFFFDSATVNEIKKLRQQELSWFDYKKQFEDIVPVGDDDYVANFIGQYIKVSIVVELEQSKWAQEYFVRVKKMPSGVKILILLASPIRNL
tara:strand:+ start:15073 stop:15894 length:822 start_codon:yes stop_codon:yes gene_type:complete